MCHHNLLFLFMVVELVYITIETVVAIVHCKFWGAYFEQVAKSCGIWERQLIQCKAFCSDLRERACKHGGEQKFVTPNSVVLKLTFKSGLMYLP